VGGAARVGWAGIAVDSSPAMFDVMNNTQSLFNSGKRQRRGADVVRIKCEVGGPHRD